MNSPGVNTLLFLSECELLIACDHHVFFIFIFIFVYVYIEFSEIGINKTLCGSLKMTEDEYSR